MLAVEVVLQIKLVKMVVLVVLAAVAWEWESLVPELSETLQHSPLLRKPTLRVAVMF